MVNVVPDVDATGIRLVNVSKSFGGVAAVRDCTVDIQAACVTGIVGPNGAGKSTVFNLISGFVVPDRGRILFRGEDLVGMSPPQVFRRGIARSFQGVRTLRNLTVIENLLLGATAADALSLIGHPKRDRARVKQALERGWRVLEDLALKDVANQPAGNLGYAEQKLLSIGRLMMTDVDVILLDEPMGGLDRNAVDGFVTRIRRLITSHQRTVCIVEHNLNVVRLVADRVVFMAEGTVKAEGPTAEVLAREDLGRLYLGVSASSSVAS